MKGEIRNSKRLHGMNALIYVLVGGFSMTIIIPIIWVFVQSIKEKSEFFGATAWALPEGVYWKNYVTAWVDAGMAKYFTNTVYVTAMSLLLVVALSIPCAYALSRFEFKGRNTISLLLMGGIFINVNYIAIPIYTLINNFGRTVGVKGLVNNLTVLSLIYAITSVPFAVYLLSGFFKGLQKEYEEAAKIDGCSYYKILMHIIVPLAKPSIVTVILFNFLKFWNEYILGITFISDMEKWTISIGLLNIMEVEKIANDYGRMYAGLTIAMVPTIVLYCLVQKKLTEGINMGGIKG